MREWLSARLPFRGGKLRREIQEHCRTKRADEFRRLFRPKRDVDYAWVYEYALAEVERLKATIGELDEKADSLVRYVGALFGVIVLLSAIAGVRGGVCLSIAAIPAAVFMLTAVTKAIGVRAPDEIPFAPTPADALRYATDWKDTNAAHGDFSALLHWHRTRLWLAINVKGTRIRGATAWFVWGLWLLLLPALYAGLTALLSGLCAALR